MNENVLCMFLMMILILDDGKAQLDILFGCTHRMFSNLNFKNARMAGLQLMLFFLLLSNMIFWYGLGCLLSWMIYFAFNLFFILYHLQVGKLRPGEVLDPKVRLVYYIPYTKLTFLHLGFLFLMHFFSFQLFAYECLRVSNQININTNYQSAYSTTQLLLFNWMCKSFYWREKLEPCLRSSTYTDISIT